MYSLTSCSYLKRVLPSCLAVFEVSAVELSNNQAFLSSRAYLRLILSIFKQCHQSLKHRVVLCLIQCWCARPIFVIHIRSSWIAMGTPRCKPCCKVCSPGKVDDLSPPLECVLYGIGLLGPLYSRAPAARRMATTSACCFFFAMSNAVLPDLFTDTRSGRKSKDECSRSCLWRRQSVDCQ